MKKTTLLNVMLIIIIVVIAFLGYGYKQNKDEIEALNSKIEELNNVEVQEPNTSDKEPASVVENQKLVMYNSSKVVNSDAKYSNSYSVGSYRGSLYIEGNKVTFSVFNQNSGSNDEYVYEVNENVSDVALALVGQGTAEAKAIVTESGKVFINMAYNKDDLSVVELTGLPKICRVVITSKENTSGEFLIGIDEDGNCYDLMVEYNKISK